MLVMCVIPVMCVMCVMCYVSSRFIYLPIHSNALKSISLKRLSGSTCLTGFEVFGVFGVFEVFKGVRLVQRLNRYSVVTPC